MIFSNSNGKRPPLKVVAVLVARSGKPSALRRHPYATAVLTVAVAALSVFVVQWLFKFPLMMMFAAPAAICFPVLGVRPGLLALLRSVVVADFFLSNHC